MTLKLTLAEFDLTILADDLSVRLFIVFFLFRLGNDVSTLFALIVVPGATDLMHAELADLHHFLTGRTFLSLFRWYLVDCFH